MKWCEIAACTCIINVWVTEILPDIGLFHFNTTHTYYLLIIIRTGQGMFWGQPYISLNVIRNCMLTNSQNKQGNGIKIPKCKL